ncbi:tyrosine-type recombinase/integrase [Pseudovibrio sp. WM33]|uniref:tyrosine-type recombinase/integrase n=1 Tax=Pseudovibrio sp. WM33 TaxID=1735585 RepID=UPI0007B21318|nr:tyrosine-type recombinase/integrase [Pseudovibrio sp. WM33]KZL29447.1 Phage integrase family protein [Pseudovibrio sp. WM33]
MTIIRVKGFKIFNDQHGKLRCYHRKTGEPINLEKAPIGSAAFLAECERLTSLMSVADTSRPGTLGNLIDKYRASSAFLELADRTKSDYQKVFDYLAPIHNTPLTRFTSPFIVKLRDKADEQRKRRFANYVKQVLSVLFSWGKERGFVKENTALGVKSIRKPKNAPIANRPWTDDERRIVLKHAPAHMVPALTLMMYTGLGPQDALTLSKQQYQNGFISTRRAKTGAPVFWPVITPLKAALDDAPEHEALTLCANSRGQPWTVSGFRASWRKLRIQLEDKNLIEPGLTLYGLRHTVATILREVGLNDRDLAAALGHETEAMARLYAKGADLRKSMSDIAVRFVWGGLLFCTEV